MGSYLRLLKQAEPKVVKNDQAIRGTRTDGNIGRDDGGISQVVARSPPRKRPWTRLWRLRCRERKAAAVEEVEVENTATFEAFTSYQHEAVLFVVVTRKDGDKCSHLNICEIKAYQLHPHTVHFISFRQWT
jgi:hypothetical protein